MASSNTEYRTIPYSRDFTHISFWEMRPLPETTTFQLQLV